MTKEFNAFFQVDDMAYTFSGNGRSKFIPAITKALKDQKQTLVAGRQIVVQLEAEKEGHSGTFYCKTNPSACSIAVNFKNPDPTRFPARIRAAARALCQGGFEGTFEISQKAGILTIRKI
jgi:hypothetical protein